MDISFQSFLSDKKAYKQELFLNNIVALNLSNCKQIKKIYVDQQLFSNPWFTSIVERTLKLNTLPITPPRQIKIVTTCI